MGNLKLLPCQPEDAAEILAGQLAAFSNPPEPFFFVLFPENEAKEKAEKRTLDWWLGDTTARYMKVVDEESGKFNYPIKPWNFWRSSDLGTRLWHERELRNSRVSPLGED